MLVQPGSLSPTRCRYGDPILGLPHLNHYSDPSFSEKAFHSENLLQSIAPIKGTNVLQQLDPALAMAFNPEAFDGVGGYVFPENNRWMMYDADPLPFQAERTVGIVFSLEGALANDMIFGYAKFNAFNTSWRVQTNSNNGGFVNFGRDYTGGFPQIIPNATPGKFIMIIRQHSINLHEFYVNSYENPVIIDPRDDYYTSNRVRLMLGRYGTTRSEVAATIGPIFDCMSLVSDTKLKEIMLHLSARVGIQLS